MGAHFCHLWCYAIAAAAAITGFGSLLLFGLFLWTSGFELVDLKMRWGAALAWDGGLCLAFFLQHSGMVRRSFRARLARLVPAHWHGMVYTIASAAALLLVTLGWQPTHILLGAVEGAAGWAIRAVFLASLSLFAWGVRALGNFDLFGTEAMLSHVRGARTPTTPLSVRGPYRWVRHPFYLCTIIIVWACPALSLDRLVFDILWTCWIVTGAILEERDLVAEFGEAYREYQRKVPMLLPWRGTAA